MACYHICLDAFERDHASLLPCCTIHMEHRFQQRSQAFAEVHQADVSTYVRRVAADWQIMVISVCDDDDEVLPARQLIRNGGLLYDASYGPRGDIQRRTSHSFKPAGCDSSDAGGCENRSNKSI